MRLAVMRVLLAVVGLLLSSYSAGADPINVVIGDASWREAHGTAPTGDERGRIQTHLRYVLGLLRARPASPGRTAALVNLERYIRRGEFPRRTHDEHPGRRPRFIDDRGVHCAVGQLIADSGYPELARAIADQHEYAYVPDITTPGLQAWAAEAGFTLVELAMIQPTYGFETGCDERPVTAPIAEAAGEIIFACGATQAIPEEVMVSIKGSSVTAVDPGAFEQCFATHAARVLATSGIRRCDVLEPPAQTATFSLPSPQYVLERQVEKLDLDARCWPRPGALARTASISVAADDKGLSVRVTTMPSNDAVNACIAKGVRARFADIGPGTWKLRASAQRHLAPRASAGRVKQLVSTFGKPIATACFPERSPPTHVDVTVTGKTDEAALAIRVSSSDEVFVRCVTERLGPKLRTALTSAGQFRIDTDVNVTANVVVQSPSERRRELGRRRDEQRRRMYGLGRNKYWE